LRVKRRKINDRLFQNERCFGVVITRAWTGHRLYTNWTTALASTTCVMYYIWFIL
jgi:hypothetical protein